MVIHIRKWHLAIILPVFVFSFVLIIFAGATEQEDNGVQLPVIMYHHVMTDERKTGKYVISDTLLEKDLEYIKGKGYETVDVEDVVEYVTKGESLPEKSIMLTFDDGFESIYTIVAPMLEKYEMCGVCSVIGSVVFEYTERNEHGLSYSYMTEDQISELMKGDTVEIHNHSYDMHDNAKGKRKGLGRLSGESESEYLKAVGEDIKLCQTYIEDIGGKEPTAIAYPYGVHNSALDELVKDIGFYASFVCEERINTIIEGNTDSLMNLGRYNRPAGVSNENFFDKLL